MEEKLYIYKLTQDKEIGWGTYDSCVVVSDCEDNARKIHPATYLEDSQWSLNNWCHSPEDVNVELIGVCTVEGYKNGDIICSSFDAG